MILSHYFTIPIIKSLLIIVIILGTGIIISVLSDYKNSGKQKEVIPDNNVE